MLKNGSELRRRDLYLNRLIAFQDTEPVKIITGIRRCGKSSLMKLMVLHLRQTGVSDDQIIEMNFESMDFRRMTAEELYRYVKERLPEKKRAYLFFDEIQRIDQWQDAVNSFRVDFDCDIYVTGSNAYDDQIRILKQNALSDRRDAERARWEQHQEHQEKMSLIYELQECQDFIDSIPQDLRGHLKERYEAQLEQEQQFRY